MGGHDAHRQPSRELAPAAGVGPTRRSRLPPRQPSGPALLWVKDGDVRYYSPDRVTIDDAEVALGAFPGSWNASWWDTRNGAWYSSARVEGGPGRTLTVPPFAADTAVRLVKPIYKCYRIEETTRRCEGDTNVACTLDQDCTSQGVDGPCLGFPKGVTATLADQLEDELFDVKGPRGLCTAVHGPAGARGDGAGAGPGVPHHLLLRGGQVRGGRQRLRDRLHRGAGVSDAGADVSGAARAAVNGSSPMQRR
jgi:hypothetical protein